MATLKLKNPDGTFYIPTIQQKLADVEKAIETVLVVGQSYTIVGGRTFSFADLETLRELRAEYENEILADNGDTGVFIGDTGGIKRGDGVDC